MNMIHNEYDTSQRRDVLSQLLLVTTLMTDDMQRGLAERGLTPTRAQVLWVLGEAERLTQRELSQRLKVTPRNVTALVDALEQTGFVRRSAHPTDRRAIVVELSNQGQDALARLRSELTAFAVQLLGDLPADELATFKAMLDRICEKLKAFAAQARG